MEEKRSTTYFHPHQQFGMSKELGHDRHIVSLLTDHMVFSLKIQAAVEFVEQGGERAVVCRLEGVVEALDGRGGTVVEK